MWNKPTEKQLASLPLLYSTEDVEEEDKIIQMHFFLGASDWWAVEYSPDDQRFFGFVILNGDMQNAEWGYFSLVELCEVKVNKFMEVDREIHWRPQQARNVLRIHEAQGWKV
jgi:hypothetical protein